MAERDEHPAVRSARERTLVAGIEPYALFCVYHLGLMPDGTFRFHNVHDAAQRFGVETHDIHDALRAYALDADTLVHSTFDLAGAQADIQVSPPGVDLTVLAEMHWHALIASHGRTRDWDKELDEDRAINARTFGDDDAR